MTDDDCGGDDAITVGLAQSRGSGIHRMLQIVGDADVEFVSFLQGPRRVATVRWRGGIYDLINDPGLMVHGGFYIIVEDREAPGKTGHPEDCDLCYECDGCREVVHGEPAQTTPPSRHPASDGLGRQYCWSCYTPEPDHGPPGGEEE